MVARSGNTTVDARVTGIENDSKPGVSWSSARTMRVCRPRWSLDWVMVSFVEKQTETEARGFRARAAHARVDEPAGFRLRDNARVVGRRAAGGSLAGLQVADAAHGVAAGSGGA